MPAKPSDILYPKGNVELTAADTAAYLGTSEEVVRRYCRTGEIAARKVKLPNIAKEVWLIPVTELHRVAFRKRRGQTRTKTVLPSGAVVWGPSLPQRG